MIDKAGNRNFWQKHGGITYDIDEYWDSKFPNYPIALSREEAIYEYCREYKAKTSKLAKLHPDKFRIVYTDELNDPKSIEDLLTWIGYDKPIIKQLRANSSAAT